MAAYHFIDVARLIDSHGRLLRFIAACIQALGRCVNAILPSTPPSVTPSSSRPQSGFETRNATNWGGPNRNAEFSRTAVHTTPSCTMNASKRRPTTCAFEQQCFRAAMSGTTAHLVAHT